MPELEPGARARKFSEVSLGYTAEMAVAEARRCHQCRPSQAKCIPNCPLGINIPKFVGHIASGNFRSAYDSLSRDNLMPGTCGRICPQERQCQTQCKAGIQGDAIGIGHLERFVGDWHIARGKSVSFDPIPDHVPGVAVIGSGPAGLACAADLARLRYSITVFEPRPNAGGLLIQGTPEFRLPAEIVRAEVENIRRMGVRFQYNAVPGGTFSLQSLQVEQGFRSIFLGLDEGTPRMPDIHGTGLKGILSADGFLAEFGRASGGQAEDGPIPFERVVVAGGGDKALDCARTALRMGASEVTVLYRRSLQELPARRQWTEHVQQEGIQFLFLSAPVRLVGDEENRLKRIECLEVELGEPDEAGRARPVPKHGSEFQLAADMLVVAFGCDAGLVPAPWMSGLETDQYGRILVDPGTRQTSMRNVFAGRRIGGASLTVAMGEGRAAARAIHRHIALSAGL